MGTWGKGPWDNDSAADWCAEVFAGVDMDAFMDDAFKYYDAWGKIRMACYLLTTLGVSAYVWPGDLERRPEHMQRGLKLLRDMAAPDGEYVSQWGDGGNPELEKMLAQEIAALEKVASTT